VTSKGGHGRVAGRHVELDVNAKRGEDGQMLMVTAVNLSAEPRQAALHLDGFRPSATGADVQELTAALNAVNSEADSERVSPQSRSWDHGLSNGAGELTFRPRSVTTIHLQ
jgi:alpha-L-arabinofuranosidase